MIKKLKLLIFWGLITSVFSSCLINKDFMFKTPEDFTFETPTIDSSNKEYRITTNSILLISLFSRSGSAIVEMTTGGNENNSNSRLLSQNNGALQYVVDKNGFVELPLIGRQNVIGLTIFEAQTYLESKYVNYINDPYCIIRVSNRRYLYFNGSGGAGGVVELGQDNISLIEAIARAGGIDKRGNSSKVKLVRTIEGKQHVYLFDLSTIDAIQYSAFAVQSGDIIYVEPMPQYSAEILNVITPALTLLSTIFLYISVVAK